MCIFNVKLFKKLYTIILHLLCLILVFFISNTIVFSQSYWTKVNSPVSVNLRNCVFTDNLNGWAAGDDGVIVHTSDGGSTFVIQNSTIPYYINDIFFLNNRLGWVVANEFLFSGTSILTTTNGGLVWTSELLPDHSLFFRTIYFRDSLNGFMGGLNGAFYKTSDAGSNWLAANVDTSEFSAFPVNRITFSSAMKGFACGGYTDVAGVIWKTSDGGFNWSAGAYSPEPFYDLYAKTIDEIISVGGDFEYGVQISKTFDAGNNWIYESLNMFGQAESIDFRTASEAWMPLGFAQSWAVSYDSGNTWKSIPAFDGAVIHSVDFADSLHGLAVGNNGVILKYNALKVSAAENITNIPGKFSLSQNYPNPFNPNTIISYSLPAAQHTVLKVYSILGNEIATLVNEKQDAGNYNYQFSTVNYQLPSGIYFYKMDTGDFSETKRMVLLK